MPSRTSKDTFLKNRMKIADITNVWCGEDKGGSRVSSKSSRTQSQVMSHKKKSIKNSFLFQGKYNELHFFVVCLFFLKYAHKKSYTSRFSDQAKCPRKNIANSTRCAQWPLSRILSV